MIDIIYLLVYNPCVYSIWDWVDEHSGFLSSVIIIVLFITERFLNKKFKRKEALSHWYSNFILNNNLEKIETYFNDSKNIIGEISDFHNRNETTNDGANIVRILDSIMATKEAFEDGFLIIISGFDSNFYRELSSITMRIQDEFSIGLLSEEYDIDGLNNFLSEQKSKFYTLLSVPVNPHYKK